MLLFEPPDSIHRGVRHPGETTPDPFDTGPLDHWPPPRSLDASYSLGVASGGHDAAQGAPVHGLPLGWWASIRLLGWSGAKAGSLDWPIAVDAHRRGVHGPRRQAALAARIDAELNEARTLAARLADPESCPSPAAVRSYLHKFANSGLAVSDLGLQRAVAALARFAAEPSLLRQLSAQLPRIAELREVAARREQQPVLAVLDLEVDSAGQPLDVAVVLLRGDERVGARRWSGIPPELDEWLHGAMLCAHNGEAHDAPVLRRHGMRVDPPVLDTLRWFWLAAPLEVAHSLRELVDRYGRPDAGRAWHTALADAEALAEALPGLRREIHGLPAATRGGLAAALAGTVDPHVLAWMLGPDSDGPQWHPTVEVQPSPIFPSARSDRVVVITSDLSAWTPDDTGLVVDADRERSVTRSGGWYLRGERLIDATVLAGSLDRGGWATAIALRLVDEANGALPLWPPSATDLLYPAGEDGPPAVAVHSQRLAVVGTGPWNCEPDTASLAPEHAPIALVDAVDLLFGAATPVRGIAEHRGPVTAVVTHAGPRGAGPVAGLWTKALGGRPRFVGNASPIDLDVILVTGLTRQPNGRRHLARVTAVAAGLSEETSVLLVTNGERRDFIEAALRSPWRATTGTHLLRPSKWPTLREAAARIR